MTLYVYFWIHNEQFCNGTKDEIELSTLYHDWKRHQDRVSYIPGSFKIQAYCMLHTACHLERDLLKSNVSGYRSYSVVIRPSSLLAPWKQRSFILLWAMRLLSLALSFLQSDQILLRSLRKIMRAMIFKLLSGKKLSEQWFSERSDKKIFRAFFHRKIWWIFTEFHRLATDPWVDRSRIDPH